MSEGQRNILNIIAELSDRALTKSVIDTAVIDRSGLPADEVRNYFGRLEGLGYITMG
jgi:hypothetical protein